MPIFSPARCNTIFILFFIFLFQKFGKIFQIFFQIFFNLHYRRKKLKIPKNNLSSKCKKLPPKQMMATYNGLGDWQELAGYQT
jgi:hypothetical protein